MCMGIPLRVEEIRSDGRALCSNAKGQTLTQPIQTVLLDTAPQIGDWLLTHIDTAIQTISAAEAKQVADALEALECAQRGDSFEHLIADLIDREPQLPEHLRPESPLRGGSSTA
ncbi:MAG: HypC/HybG/HupF family hydrogenase formation chaperone [Congregibacter sp.]